MRVIVTNCFSRIGLAAVNALAPEHEVIGSLEEAHGLRWLGYERWLRSRKIRDVFEHPAPERDAAGFTEAILDACRRYEADIVLPTSTGLAIALSRAKAQIPPDLSTVFGVEDWETLSWFADKWQSHQLCERLGVPTPRTVLPVGDASAELDDMSLPLVAKPRLSEGARGVRFFHRRDELRSFLESAPSLGVATDGAFPYIVQEYVPGAIHDAGCCTFRGKPVTLYSQCRVVTRYAFGGPSFSVQLTDEPEIREHAARILGHLGWNGFVVSEFIRTPEGRYYFLEGNPRFGAALQLIVEAGMNLCRQTVEIFALGREPAATLDYPVGMACKWYSPEAFAICMQPPRTPRAIARRARSVFLPYRPGPTISNLRVGDLRHLTGIFVHGIARKRASASPVRTPAATPIVSASARPQVGD